MNRSSLFHRATVHALVATLFVSPFFSGTSLDPGGVAEGGEFLKKINELKRPVDNLFGKKKPHLPKEASVEEMAKLIDGLEHHIEVYGTIVAKQPDVWGESRLTRHRDEYETQIFKRFDESRFTANLQGAIRRSDQAQRSGAYGDCGFVG